MATTVNDIQDRVEAIAGQSFAATTDSDEYALRLSFINRAIEEYGQAYDFDDLRKITFLSVTGVSQGSLSLPADFRKMASFPLTWATGYSEGEQWPQINPDTVGKYGTSDKYFYILGDRGNGYTMFWHPATLASGATIQIQYFSYPTSLASPANVIPIQSTEYVVNKTLSYIFQTRNDARFKLFESQARENLLGVISNQDDKSKAFGTNNYVGVTINQQLGFRVGRD